MGGTLIWRGGVDGILMWRVVVVAKKLLVERLGTEWLTKSILEGLVGLIIEQLLIVLLVGLPLGLLMLLKLKVRWFLRWYRAARGKVLPN